MYKDVAILLHLQPVDSLPSGKSALAIKSAHLATQEVRVDRASGPDQEVALWYSNHRRSFFHHLAAYFA